MINVTSANPKTQPTSPAAKLEQAISLARDGQKLEARDMLRQIVALQPVNQAAWLWLSALATERSEAEAALVHARAINPLHPSLVRAEQWLTHRFSTQPDTQEMVFAAPPPVTNKKTNVKKTAYQQSGFQPVAAVIFSPHQLFRRVNSFTFGVIMAVILTGLLVLFVGLTLEVQATVQPQAAGTTMNESRLAAAQAEHDWARVATILEERRRVEPDAPGLTTQLANAYLQKGLTLRRKGFVEEARTDFSRVVALQPYQPQADQELRLAAHYLAGIKQYQAGQWAEAITHLTAVRAGDVDYPNVTDLLFSAYYNQGLSLRAANQLPQAKEAFTAAATLRPDQAESRRQITDLEYALAPQTPLPTPTHAPADAQLIVVGIAEQRMHVYKNGELVFDFVVSTGEPGRDTAIGKFQILDKIDVAYASTWNLDMPYWQGIYWSGTLENGIHALPIVKHTGYKLWDGYLGQRVSYGCVILSDEDAATLYRWAEIGARVKIVPSLVDWAGE